MSRLTGSRLQSVLAYEYGWLDAKHHMGYHPRHGHGQSYREGYESNAPQHTPRPIPAGSYADKVNWGWY